MKITIIIVAIIIVIIIIINAVVVNNLLLYALACGLNMATTLRGFVRKIICDILVDSCCSVIGS